MSAEWRLPFGHELTYGCHRLPRGKRRDALETYPQDVVLASFPVLAYDELAAHWHGHERARLEGLGDRPRTSTARLPPSLS